MSEFDNDFEVMEETTEEGGRDYSTAVGVGVIAVGGVLLYEGGKKAFKLAKTGFGKLKDHVTNARAAKAEPAGEAEVDPTSSAE